MNGQQPESWGAICQPGRYGPGDPELLARAKEILDRRDQEHYGRFGHTPGGRQNDGRPCSLPDRSQVQTQALLAAAEGSKPTTDTPVLSGSSWDIAQTLRLRAPMAPIAVVPERPRVPEAGILINGRPAL
jgi:hypothetical protein